MRVEGGEGENFRPVGEVFSPCVYEKKHRNISQNIGWLAKFGWILTSFKIRH